MQLEVFGITNPWILMLVFFGIAFGVTLVVGVIIGVLKNIGGGGRTFSHAWIVGAGGILAQLSISLDLQPFFDSMNAYLPTFMALFGLIGGIVAAMQFSQYIVGIVTRALSGRAM